MLPDEDKTKKKSVIQVLERAVDILDLLAQSDEPMRSVDIAKQLGVSPQCVGNLLRTLYNRGMVSQEKCRRYRLGPHCFYLGDFADSWRDLREESRPVLHKLRETTGESVFLGIIENDKLFCLSLLAQGDTYFSKPPQFWTEQLHSTACGRLLLSLLPADEREKMLKRIHRSQVTELTVTSPEELEVRCAVIAQDGFAEILEESVRGVWSLAVPVVDPTGSVAAGLSIYGRMDSYKAHSRKERLNWLFDAASEISKVALRKRLLK